MQNQLRPSNFEEFIGQEQLKKVLLMMIESSSKQKIQLDHILIHGSPGLGKTSLAYVIGKKIDAKIKYSQGSLLEKKSDILSLFASIHDSDIIFIDEIHSINKNIEELLHSAMEDGVIDVTIGPEGDKKVIRMSLPNFTLIGATTKIEEIPKPLRDRFGLTSRIHEYNKEDIIKIIDLSLKRLKIKMDDDAKLLLVNNSQNIPRIVNNLLKRVKDFSIVKNIENISIDNIKVLFHDIGLFDNGLKQIHIRYLNNLHKVFGGRWVSLSVISAILNENQKSILNEIEPLLLGLYYIEKSSKGRKITNGGIDYLVNTIR